MHAGQSLAKQPKRDNQMIFGDSDNEFDATDGINNYINQKRKEHHEY